MASMKNIRQPVAGGDQPVPMQVVLVKHRRSIKKQLLLMGIIVLLVAIAILGILYKTVYLPTTISKIDQIDCNASIYNCLDVIRH